MTNKLTKLFKKIFFPQETINQIQHELDNGLTPRNMLFTHNGEFGQGWFYEHGDGIWSLYAKDKAGKITNDGYMVNYLKKTGLIEAYEHIAKSISLRMSRNVVLSLLFVVVFISGCASWKLPKMAEVIKPVEVVVEPIKQPEIIQPEVVKVVEPAKKIAKRKKSIVKPIVLETSQPPKYIKTDEIAKDSKEHEKLGIIIISLLTLIALILGIYLWSKRSKDKRSSNRDW